MDEAISLLKQARRIFMVTHISPDGDAIGSMLGLGWALRGLGKECVMCCGDQVPTTYSYLPGADDIHTQGPEGTEDLIVVLDASDLDRLGKVGSSRVFSEVPTLNVDHHVTNKGFGTCNLVDEKAAATAELIWDIISGLGVDVNRDMATCLLTAIVGDTRSFCTVNTTPRTLHIAANLIQAGAPLATISSHLFNNRSLADVRLWGKTLDGVRNRNGVIWTEITRGMREEVGASQEEGNGVANFLLGLDGTSVALVFKEQDDGLVDVSLRAKPEFDVSRVAAHFGGGGHPQASGLVMAGELQAVRDKVLSAIEESLRLSEKS
jgi:phosphoesterase RecJ-like protein